MEIIITINGEEMVLDVDARMVGKYVPGNYENPPEYPELHIYSIKDEEGREIDLSKEDEQKIADIVQEILENE